MALRYPIVFIIVLILIFVFFFLYKNKHNQTYEDGKKIANTKYIKNHNYFKKLLKQYKLLAISSKVLCIIAIICSLVLLSRPVSVNKSNTTMYNRDIFLCMDISTSVVELDQDLVQTLKDTVENLQGERFGISIFNTSSILLVPLTDDYDYVLEVLDQLDKSLGSVDSYSFSDDYLYDISYLYSGTSVGNETRGSSLIGDGLASCVYSFKNLEEERTRIIIFSTDNDLAGSPYYTLEEASKLANSKNILVYALAPKNMKTTNQLEMRNAITSHNGKYYSNGTTTVEDIVNDIEKTSKTYLKGKEKVTKTDVPLIPFICLLTSIFILYFISRKVIKK